MYITQDIANRIKLLLKTKNKNMKAMLSDIGLGINAISEFSKGKQLSCISLAKIADYLDCSVDYLLGRSEISGSSYLTEEEKQFLQAYNAHPEYHAAVKAMLGIDNTDDIKLAAQKKPVKPITD